jgi:hypothetical protein
MKIPWGFFGAIALIIIVALVFIANEFGFLHIRPPTVQAADYTQTPTLTMVGPTPTATQISEPDVIQAVGMCNATSSDGQSQYPAYEVKFRQVGEKMVPNFLDDSGSPVPGMLNFNGQEWMLVCFTPEMLEWLSKTSDAGKTFEAMLFEMIGNEPWSKDTVTEGYWLFRSKDPKFNPTPAPQPNPNPNPNPNPGPGPGPEPTATAFVPAEPTATQPPPTATQEIDSIRDEIAALGGREMAGDQGSWFVLDPIALGDLMNNVGNKATILQEISPKGLYLQELGNVCLAKTIAAEQGHHLVQFEITDCYHGKPIGVGTLNFKRYSGLGSISWNSGGNHSEVKNHSTEYRVCIGSICIETITTNPTATSQPAAVHNTPTTAPQQPKAKENSPPPTPVPTATPSFIYLPEFIQMMKDHNCLEANGPIPKGGNNLVTVSCNTGEFSATVSIHFIPKDYLGYPKFYISGAHRREFVAMIDISSVTNNYRFYIMDK